MHKVHLLTTEEAGRLLQLGLVTTSAPKKAFGEFISMKQHNMFTLVETGASYFGRVYTIKLEDVYGISAPIAQVGDRTIYGAIYLTRNSTLLRRRFTVSDKLSRN